MPGTTFSYFTGLPEGPWICRKLIFASDLRAEWISTGIETSERRSWPFQIARDAMGIS